MEKPDKPEIGKDSNSDAKMSTHCSDGKPSPSDFDVFLPWACVNMSVDVNVSVSKVKQSEYVSSIQTDRLKSKARLAKQKQETENSDENDEKSLTRDPKFAFNTALSLQIFAYYDTSENLVHIKFDKNKYIPRRVIQIIALISQFHKHLTSITINRGLDVYVLHEINKIVQLSVITDLCLDGTYVKQGNYYILFESANRLRQVSLARCMIDDDSLKKIVDFLVYPLAVSKSLSVLNLSSNKITDRGAKFLAEVLRSNRRLLYLNVADNMINDEGALAILDVMIPFLMSNDECLSSKQRYMQYLKEKKDMVSKLISELKATDDRKSAKRKNTKAAAVLPVKKGVKGIEKEPSLKSIPAEVNKSNTNIDSALLEKAENIASNNMGPFLDPFSLSCTESKGGSLYCLGNNILAYLNIAYNNLSYISLKKIHNVVTYQRLLNRRPKGLVNLRLEGNTIPICKELHQVDEMLERSLMMPRYSLAGMKKTRLGNQIKGK